LDSSPIDINLGNAVYWIRQTVRNERIHSRDHRRQLSAMRLVRMLRPNLRQPVFAIGAPRSGTTFLGACLKQLPEISYHFEPVITKAAVRCVADGDWSEFKARLVYRSTYAWLMRMSGETDLRFCEKTPGNCFILPFLSRTFGDAKFIHIVRDGRDSALSLSKKPWYANASRDSGLRDPDGYRFGPSTRFWVEPDRTGEYESTNDLHRCIWLWRRYVECALEGARAIPAGNYLEVRYEDLLASPADYADRISDFLGIATASSRRTFRDTMAGDAHADSIGRWKQEVDDADIRQLHEEAGNLLEKLGYPV
jgi:hypothetical protein